MSELREKLQPLIDEVSHLLRGEDDAKSWPHDELIDKGWPEYHDAICEDIVTTMKMVLESIKE